MNTPEVTQPPTAVVGVTPGELAADVTAYRRELRHFLRTEPQLDAWRVDPAQSTEEILQSHARLLALLYSAGWNRYGWPPAVAGLGGSEIHRAVLYEELSMADLPIPEQCMTLDTVGPAVLGFAPELAAKLLPGYLRGAEWWGQAFSEPDAGSDLAALRTRGSIDNDRMIISGQKIWTSQGATATRLLCLVRTGAPESRHRGLTIVLVDTDCPGITIRPIALASGQRELAEVFFDDVRVPGERVVGDVGGGWAVAMHLMQFERGMYGYAVLTKVVTELSRLREEMVIHGATSAQRERFARVYVDVVSAQARTATTVRRLARGESVGADSSIDKLLFGRAEKEANDLILDIQRDQMIAGKSSAELDTIRAEWWYSRAATIMGGTAEVQRGIIADHLLGLPKERRGQ